MSHKTIVAACALGLILVAAGCWALAPAMEKPVAQTTNGKPVDKTAGKTPAPTRPLPPAKPQSPPKQAPSESQAAATPTELLAPMPTTDIDRALAKKVDLNLPGATLSEFVAEIKRQTGLEVRISPDALNPKLEDKSETKSGNRNKQLDDKPAEKARPEKKVPGNSEPDKAAPNNAPQKSMPQKSPLEKPAPGKSATPPAVKPADKPSEPSTAKPSKDLAPAAPASATAKDDEPAEAAEPVVSVHVKGITAASALDLVLRDVGLSWAIDHGGIYIAPAGELPATTAVYDVRDLVVAHPAFDSHDDSVELDYDPLVNLITGVIQCPGWSGDVDKVQDCNPFHGTLTVHQDQPVQQKVAGLLAAMRRARDLAPSQYNPSPNLGFAIGGADDSAVAAALDANVEVNFNAAKLDQVADWIRAHCDIPVHIDSTVPQTVEDTQPFTLKAAGVSLRAMLKVILPQGKLAFTVADETLVITSQDALSDLRSIRVYPVGDMISAEIDDHGIDEDYGQLLDSITHNVQPDSWAPLDRQKPSPSVSTGNAYAAYLPAAQAIVIDQTSVAHDEIAATLAKLRGAVAKQPAEKRLVAGGGEKSSAKEPANRYLSMRIYKLNSDLPADDFVAVVRDLIEPKSWTGEAYLHGVPGAIVVRATPAIHKRVERLLIELGAIPDPKKNGSSGTPILVGRQKKA